MYTMVASYNMGTYDLSDIAMYIRQIPFAWYVIIT